MISPGERLTMATILLIEDEPNQRFLYQMELGDEGYRIFAPATVEEALETVRKRQADLVILDPHLKNLEEIQ